jgi:hypothetical protein
MILLQKSSSSLSLSLSSQINDLIVGLQFLFGRMITILNLFSNYYLFAVVVVDVESFVYSFEFFFLCGGKTDQSNESKYNPNPHCRRCVNNNNPKSEPTNTTTTKKRKR